MPSKKESISQKTSKRLLEHEDARLFFKLIHALEMFISLNTKALAAIKQAGKPVSIGACRQAMHDAWLADKSLIDQFIAKDGQTLTEEEKQIVLGWKAAIYDKFVCIKYYADYAVMQGVESPTLFYGVLALSEDFKTMIPENPPCFISTTLLPFKGKIVWNGICGSYHVNFGTNLRKDFLDGCREARKKNLIKMSLSIL